MASEFGNTIRVSIFGESHGAGVGAVLSGLPAGEAVDLEELQRFLDRRAPGKNAWSTARRETDVPRVVSGLKDGVTTGAPLSLLFNNSDTHSGDYDALMKFLNV